MPTAPRLDQEIILICAITANFCKRNRHALRTDARCFGQDLLQVGFAEGKAAKLRKRSLLAQEFLDGARSAHAGDA